MILLVLVVLLWVAVLAPSAWRRFAERPGVGSIDHFHHQLQLLEHAAPKTVAPAYRLHTALPGNGTSAPPAERGRTSRPQMVPVRQTADVEAADVDDSDGVHYERVGVWTDPNRRVCQRSVQTSPRFAGKKLAAAARFCCAACGVLRSPPA